MISQAWKDSYFCTQQVSIMKITNYAKWGLYENNYETEGLLFQF